MFGLKKGSATQGDRLTPAELVANTVSVPADLRKALEKAKTARDAKRAAAAKVRELVQANLALKGGFGGGLSDYEQQMSEALGAEREAREAYAYAAGQAAALRPAYGDAVAGVLTPERRRIALEAVALMEKLNGLIADINACYHEVDLAYDSHGQRVAFPNEIWAQLKAAAGVEN